AHRLESLLAELAAEHGLTALEARTLRALLDGPSQGGLARQLGRAPSGVSVLTRRLEERGLVSRVSSRSDKRVRTARPTEAGLRVIRAIGAGLAERSPPSTRRTDPEAEALYRRPPGGLDRGRSPVLARGPEPAGTSAERRGRLRGRTHGRSGRGPCASPTVPARSSGGAGDPLDSACAAAALPGGWPVLPRPPVL